MSATKELNTPTTADRAAPTPLVADRSALALMKDYASIARPDHWFKNVFMALGVLLAFFYYPHLFTWSALGSVALAVVATCLIASSNYTINEILDAPRDRLHPSKRNRPVPAGRIWLPAGYIQWVLLGAAGLGLASLISWPFFWTGLSLLIMGLAYNVPPVRTKELPYIDVLSESVNNPIRLLLGWFAVTTGEVPPVSLLIAYWMIGAFFMGAKRLAEYRYIGDPARAAAYRNSFRYYDESKLLVSLFGYVSVFGLFSGVFIIRYHLELMLLTPLVAGFVCYYMFVALKPDSAAQSPEKLYRERGLMLYLCVCVLAFFVLMFAEIPALYTLFNVQPSPVNPLWKI